MMAALVAAFGLAAGVAAQDNGAAGSRPSRFDATRKTATGIVSQPARDVGASKIVVPPVLAAARANPYGMTGTASCQQLAAGVKALDGALGPDFAPSTVTKENRASKLAEAGGKTVVNSLIPFRSLIREMTGSAPAQRRLDAAVDAGYARRGFLRGLHRARRCRTAL